MLGDVALERILAFRVGHAGTEGEIGDTHNEGLKAIQFNQVEIVGHAVDQVHRMLATLFGNLLQHCGERRQPRATS
ncbi:hypothetical protein D9M71_820430 [compost metagenome]